MNLNFTAPENCIYDFTSSLGTSLNCNSINAQKGETYNLNYNFQSSSYGKIAIDNHNSLRLGSNEIYAGYSVLDIDCEKAM